MPVDWQSLSRYSCRFLWFLFQPPVISVLGFHMNVKAYAILYTTVGHREFNLKVDLAERLLWSFAIFVETF